MEHNVVDLENLTIVVDAPIEGDFIPLEPVELVALEPIVFEPLEDVILPSFEEVLPPPLLECGPGKVPGWLDENGNPTSCVDDNPTPNVPKEEVPVEVPGNVIPVQPEVESVTSVVQPVSTPMALADTGGMDTAVMYLIAGVLVIGGVVAMIKGRAKNV